ncbi:PVC-type heme-binding CxxCH protein [Prosthecobacter sp.]|uniref:PVC-type heme-binding CxxCH protein n=1 Tax=Prosthecobacter sp. TaxID=1965333 RepID=UPI003783D7A4
MQRPLIVWLALTLCSSIPGISAEELKFPTTPPTEPQNAAKTFHVLDGFQMQLIAAEPLVTDPVAITYDEDGRAYVCEMNDYPYTDKEHHKHAQENPTDQAIGKVRLLTDTDGDGIFDKATVFAEGLSWPTGAACWKGGIFVTATPDVWYLKDTNGDGVADVRQKVFTGFKKLNVQAVMNNPIWGLDHRIYIAGGSNGGEIQRAPGSESVMPLPADFKPLSIKRNDFSFDPSTGDVRLESGGARFGNTFDDWGNRFLCNIRNPCQHVVLPYRYLARNPYLVVPSALNDCAEAGDQLPVYRTSPPEPWREFRAKRWLQEGSTLPKSELVGAGVVTSSAGITVYRGDAYPPEYRDFVFVADVAGNLFYRMKLVPDGVTFKAVQVDGNKNFCTSDDLWSRPVNFVNAPDGCLHVCDMYREVIEHPWSIPDDIHSAVDLLRGRDKGRLFRLAPKSFKTRGTPKLSAVSTAELVALLDHPNAWHRETAQRLLFERQDKAAVEPLRQLVTKGSTPPGKMAALWVLESLNFFGSFDVKRFDEIQDSGSYMADDNTPKGWTLLEGLGFTKEGHELLKQAIKDENPYVRKEALLVRPQALLAPTTLNELYELRPETAALLGDRNPVPAIEAIRLHVRFLSPASLDAIGRLCVIHRDNPQVLQAALLAVGDFPTPPLLKVVFSPEFGDSKTLQDFAGECMKMIGRRCKDIPVNDAPFHACLALVRRGPIDAITMRLLGDLATELRRSRTSLQKIVFHHFRTDSDQEWLQRFAERVRKSIADEQTPPMQRISAITLLPEIGDSAENARKVFPSLLSPNNNPEIITAALEALGSYWEPVVADVIIEAWPTLTPPLREKAAIQLLERVDHVSKLLDAIETKAIPVNQLSAATKAMLGRQKLSYLQERVSKLIGDGGSSNRKEVITKYEPVLSMTGNPANGAKVYETLCMVCHRHLDRGNDVGPNLGTIKAWTAEQILTNVFDPNREVSPNFALYIVETNDGRTLSGLITSETAGNLTLKRADGGTDTVLRSEIKSLTSPGISLMPEGLEAAITPQQMADLIEYLKK